MPSPPHWLTELADKVATQLEGVDQLSPIGCHYYYDTDQEKWEVSLFAAKTETVGGQFDGVVTSSNFTIDLQNIPPIFSKVQSFRWQALPYGVRDELGPHLSIEGYYEGHLVWLRILANAPKRFGRGRLAKVYELRLEDVW